MILNNLKEQFTQKLTYYVTGTCLPPIYLADNALLSL